MARLGAQIIDLRAQIIKSCTQNVCFFLHDMSQTPEILLFKMHTSLPQLVDEVYDAAGLEETQ